MDDKESAVSAGGVTTLVGSPKQYTYGAVIAYGSEVADADFSNGRSYSNCLGVLAGFRAFHRLSGDGCLVGPELDGNFEPALSQYVAHRKANGKDTSIPNDKSRLRWWRGVYERLRQRDRDAEDLKPKDSLWETLEFYANRAMAKNSSLSLSSIARNADLHGSFVSHTIYHKRNFIGTPTPKSSIEKLEKVLNIPAGQLIRFCKEPRIDGSEDEAIEYRARLQKRGPDKTENLTFRPWEFCAPLKEDWNGYLGNKALPLQTAGLKRNDSWRLRPVSDSSQFVNARVLELVRSSDDQEGLKEQARAELVSLNGKHYVPTADVELSKVSYFFGELRALRTPAGDRLFDPAGFRLAYMADSALLDIVASKLAQRLHFSSTVKNIYLSAESMLLQKQGFIWQQPKYVNALPSLDLLSRILTPEQLEFALRHELDDGRIVERPTPEDFAKLSDKERRDKWHAWCDDQRLLMKEALKATTIISKTRDPEDPILTYLDWDTPVLVLDQLADSMRAALDEKAYLLRQDTKLLLERTYIFTLIEKHQPLRALNMSQLTFNDKDHGSEHHLYRRYDQHGKLLCYAIRIKVEHFKNWREAQAKDYNFALPSDLNAPITRYLTEILPKFGYSGKGSFPVFPSRSGKTESVENLERIFCEQTVKFIPGCIGFRPHACRHLVATDIIKNVFDGRRIAALVLHDQLSTVEKRYQHVGAKHGHKAWQGALADRRLAQVVAMAEEHEQQTEGADEEELIAKAKSVLGVVAFRRLINHFSRKGGNLEELDWVLDGAR